MSYRKQGFGSMQIRLTRFVRYRNRLRENAGRASEAFSIARGAQKTWKRCQKDADGSISGENTKWIIDVDQSNNYSEFTLC